MAYIETPRLRLRRWQSTDLNPFVEMNTDPDVMRFFPEPYSEQRSRQIYDLIQAEFAQYGYGLYAAEVKAGSHFIGFIGFHHAVLDVDFCPCIEIGWRLTKAHWNRGYATEGAAACLKHGFAKLGLRRVYSYTAEHNLPSQRVMQKTGMSLHCRFEHPEVPDGHPLRPHVCYVINPSEVAAQPDATSF